MSPIKEMLVEVDDEGNIYVNLTQEGRDLDGDVMSIRHHVIENFAILAILELQECR